MIATTDATLTARCSFASLVSLHCRNSGYPDPEARDLDAWLEAVWPMVSEDMDAARWARAYLLAVGLAEPVQSGQDTGSVRPANGTMLR